MPQEEFSNLSDLEPLTNKGGLLIMMAISNSKDGMTFSEIKEETGLSNGTIQRRLEELEQANWIEKNAEINESGRPVKIYSFSEETREVISAFKDLVSALLE